jgi:hypothetical protein
MAASAAHFALLDFLLSTLDTEAYKGGNGVLTLLSDVIKLKGQRIVFPTINAWMV